LCEVGLRELMLPRLALSPLITADLNSERVARI
jgi:hypothetical protein